MCLFHIGFRFETDTFTRLIQDALLSPSYLAGHFCCLHSFSWFYIYCHLLSFFFTVLALTTFYRFHLALVFSSPWQLPRVRSVSENMFMDSLALDPQIIGSFVIVMQRKFCCIILILVVFSSTSSCLKRIVRTRFY